MESSRVKNVGYGYVNHFKDYYLNGVGNNILGKYVSPFVQLTFPFKIFILQLNRLNLMRKIGGF